MPFIRTTTSAVLDQEKEEKLIAIYGDAVSRFLGKAPVRMMTAVEGGIHMRRGLEKRDVPTAFVECKFFGGENYENFREFDESLKKSLCGLLGTAPSDLYIKYEVINGWDAQTRIFKI